MSADAGLLASIGAQVGAEVRTRLRSTATLVALAAILLGAYLWIPEPGGRATSISWTLPDGRLQAAEHSAALIGAAMSFLGGALAVMVGFYLVAGSIRRDRLRGIGAILAATPLSNGAYLAGKFLAHVAYLSVLELLILPIGAYHFLRFGVGAFDAAAFFGPLALIALPGIAFVAAMAVLFDVAPGLSGRAGLVIWFFVLALVAGALPVAQARNPETGAIDRIPAFDPLGGATMSELVRRSLPEVKGGTISTGLIIRDRPAESVAWRGLDLEAGFAVRRLAGIAWALPPLLLALLLFDRFDPARRKLGLRRRADRALGAAPGAAEGRAEAPVPASPAAVAPRGAPGPAAPAFAALTPVRVEPSVLRAVVADARLLWSTSSIARYPLVAAALAVAFVPSAAAPMVGAAFLLILAAVISEAPCREDLAGAAPLVFSQPGIPRSAVLWKLGAIALFVITVGSPFVLRAVATSPARGVAALSGLLFVAALAVAFGALSGGGKLFLALFLGLWYAALNRIPTLDFCGLFGGDLGLGVRAAYLATGAILIALAMVVESRRRAERLH